MQHPVGAEVWQNENGKATIKRGSGFVGHLIELGNNCSLTITLVENYNFEIDGGADWRNGSNTSRASHPSANNAVNMGVTGVTGALIYSASSAQTNVIEVNAESGTFSLQNNDSTVSALYAENTAITLNGSTNERIVVKDNSSVVSAIYLVDDSELVINGATISQNGTNGTLAGDIFTTCLFDGSEVSVKNVDISNNRAQNGSAFTIKDASSVELKSDEAGKVIQIKNNKKPHPTISWDELPIID